MEELDIDIEELVEAVIEKAGEFLDEISDEGGDGGGGLLDGIESLVETVDNLLNWCITDDITLKTDPFDDVDGKPAIGVNLEIRFPLGNEPSKYEK